MPIDTSSLRPLEQNPEWTPEERAEARKMAESLDDANRQAILRMVSSARVEEFLLRAAISANRGKHPAEWPRPITAAEHNAAIDELLADECLPIIRRQNEQAAIEENRPEQERWQEYLKAVNARAFLEGNQADEFIKHWTKLVQERQELEELGESTGVADRKLERLVGGVPFGAAAVPGTGPNEDAADAAPRRARKAAAR